METVRRTSMQHHRPARGLTMVELLVSMALLSLVTLATVSLYTVTSTSYRTIDSSQQLQDTARYVFDIIGQSLRTAGYQEYMPRFSATTYGSLTDRVFNQAGSTVYRVVGFNNSTISNVTTVDYFGATDSGGVNSSDTLAVRFFGSSQADDPTTADGSIYDCQGTAVPTPVAISDLGLSLFWVRNDSSTKNEPELSCINNGRSSASIARGIEVFQVIYGIDTNADGVPDKWLSAHNLTSTTWPQVVAVKVGIVVRGDPGSSQAQSATAADNTLYPFGKEFVGSLSETGFSFAAPNDGRIRKAFTATFMLRNYY